MGREKSLPQTLQRVKRSIQMKCSVVFNGTIEGRKHDRSPKTILKADYIASPTLSVTSLSLSLSLYIYILLGLIIIYIIRIIKPRKMRWVGHVARIGEKRNAYRLLVGKPKGRRPLGRPRRRWVDNGSWRGGME
jgi:hypothetical protein